MSSSNITDICLTGGTTHSKLTTNWHNSESLTIKREREQMWVAPGWVTHLSFHPLFLLHQSSWGRGCVRLNPPPVPQDFTFQSQSDPSGQLSHWRWPPLHTDIYVLYQCVPSALEVNSTSHQLHFKLTIITAQYKSLSSMAITPHYISSDIIM